MSYGTVHERQTGSPAQSLTIATFMMAATVVGMYLVGQSAIAEAVFGLFSWGVGGFPVGLAVGALLFSGALILGRYLAMDGLSTGNQVSSIGGGFIVLTVFSLFGGAVLYPFPEAIWADALLITGGIVTLLTAALARYIVWGPGGGPAWRTASNICFLVSFLVYLIGAGLTGFSGPVGSLLITIGVVGVLLGWVIDLGYELYEMKKAGRSRGANGFAIYVAAAGVFVHLLQFVLRALARDS